MNYPCGVHLDAPGGPYERALTAREVRRHEIEDLTAQCERAIARAQNLLSLLEDSDNGDTTPRLETLAERLEAAVIAAGGRTK